MTRYQRVKYPDCACVIYEAYDLDTDEFWFIETQPDKPENQTVRCAAHQGLTIGELQDAIKGRASTVNGNPGNPNAENKRRSAIWNAIVTSTDFDLGSIVNNPDGTSEFKLKAGINVSLEWTGTGKDRVCNVVLTGASLNNQKKNAIQNWINTNFPQGSITVTYA